MASLATIFRQVAREGARWGLFPVIKDGKVKVCELVNELPERSVGALVVPHREQRVVCSLDESSPMDAFASVLKNRLRREHHDFMKLVQSRRDRLRRAEQALADARRRDLRAELERRLIRQRIMSIGPLGR